ncbi:MAG: choice-of-anchor tandem repeat GloVer-containing protein [Candidatus Cybelea sp.]
MTVSIFNRYAFSISVAAALLAACGGSQPPIGAPGATAQSRALGATQRRPEYTVLYSFGASPDGDAPRASLVDVGGTLYGTTEQGGANTCGNSSGYFGCGTIFSVTTAGKEKVLYSFGVPPDGNGPRAGLIDAGGTLYGTTQSGGSYTCVSDSQYFGCGTVFSVTTSGGESVVHHFAGGANDGAEPQAPLIAVKGTLYGTTSAAGASHGGTVFSVTTDGKEKVLDGFSGHGDGPTAGLIDAKDTLYGTTSGGGSHHDGTVFSITLAGKVQVLHSFNGADGKEPHGLLLDVKGTFYGTTAGGGSSGDGTVFSITTGGTEKVLYSFGGGTDGANPYAGLVDVNGTLYGTTSGGGGTSCGGTVGCGTVFSITTSGTEKVLHRFSLSDGADATSPLAGLVDVSGTLYGTTFAGGSNGNGTVFALKP